MKFDREEIVSWIIIVAMWGVVGFIFVAMYRSFS